MKTCIFALIGEIDSQSLLYIELRSILYLFIASFVIYAYIILPLVYEKRNKRNV